MRVLFTPYPSLAHFLPMVPLAWAFQNAGHQVLVSSHSAIEDAIAAAGLTAVSLGDPRSNEARNRADAPTPAPADEVMRYAEVLGLAAEDLVHWIEFYQYMLVPVADYVRLDLPEAANLIAFARQWRPDLVLWDPSFACAPVAARACGAAHARILLGADCFAWALDRLAERREAVRAAGLPENPLADLVRPLAERYGFEADTELLLGQWSIDPTPADYGPPTDVRTVRLRQVPYAGGEPFAPWLHAPPGRPRVALTLGESHRRFIPGDWDRTPRIMEAVADLDIEVIATLNDLQTQGLERIPDNVRTIEWVPLPHLLPTCSAVIHHGGPGSFAASRACRIPQLVCDTGESELIRPQIERPAGAETGTYRTGREFGVTEQTGAEAMSWSMPAKAVEASIVGEYVTRHGAGAVLNHRAGTVQDIGKLIMQVVTDSAYQSGADEVHRTWLDTPGPADVVGTLEALTEWHRR